MPATKAQVRRARAARRRNADKTIDELLAEHEDFFVEVGATDHGELLTAAQVRKLVRISALLKQRIESGQESRSKEREATRVRKQIHELLGVDPAVVRQRR